MRSSITKHQLWTLSRVALAADAGLPANWVPLRQADLLLEIGLVETRRDSPRLFVTAEGLLILRRLRATPRGAQAAVMNVAPPYLAKSVAAEVRDIRVQAGLTQEALAALLGKNQTFVQSKENGYSSPDDTYVSAVREACRSARAAPAEIQVRSVRALRGYRLALRFSDGTRGTVDIAKRVAGKALAAVRDPSMFARAYVEHGVVSWPCGASISSETLRTMAFDALLAWG